jgi:pimeloyl-ACP methyl ester carboxylesterase
MTSGRIFRRKAWTGSHPTELEAWLRRNYAPFGPNTDAFWRRMADTSARRTDNGRVTVHYDPKLVLLLTQHQVDRNLWPSYDAITAKTLLIRGEDSDVLSAKVAAEMVRRGPNPRLKTMPGVGHAPTLASDAEIGFLREFLAE